MVDGVAELCQDCADDDPLNFPGNNQTSCATASTWTARTATEPLSAATDGQRRINGAPDCIRLCRLQPEQLPRQRRNLRWGFDNDCNNGAQDFPGELLDGDGDGAPELRLRRLRRRWTATNYPGNGEVLRQRGQRLQRPGRLPRTRPPTSTATAGLSCVDCDDYRSATTPRPLRHRSSATAWTTTATAWPTSPAKTGTDVDGDGSTALQPTATTIADPTNFPSNPKSATAPTTIATGSPASPVAWSTCDGDGSLACADCDRHRPDNAAQLPLGNPELCDGADNDWSTAVGDLGRAIPTQRQRTSSWVVYECVDCVDFNGSYDLIREQQPRSAAGPEGQTTGNFARRLPGCAPRRRLRYYLPGRASRLPARAMSIRQPARQRRVLPTGPVGSFLQQRVQIDNVPGDSAPMSLSSASGPGTPAYAVRMINHRRSNDADAMTSFFVWVRQRLRATTSRTSSQAH